MSFSLDGQTCAGFLVPCDPAPGPGASRKGDARRRFGKRIWPFQEGLRRFYHSAQMAANNMKMNGFLADRLEFALARRSDSVMI
jgi:hypothetical protein